MRGIPVALAVSLTFLVPLAPALPPLDVGHDDAGSGQDAPGVPEPDIIVEPDILYDATISYTDADDADHYAFHAAAGQSVHARADGFWGCVWILGPAGGPLSDSCSFGQEHRYSVWATTQETGIHYLRVSLSLQLALGPLLPPASEHVPYRFVFTLDGFAPPTDGIADGNAFTDDAASGHDAPDAAVPLIRLHDQDRPTGFVGWATGDKADWYAFEGRAGQTVEVSSYAGPDMCLEVRTGIGNEDPCTKPLIDDDEQTFGVAYRKIVQTLSHNGTFFVYVNGIHAHYGLGLGIDAPAPQPAIPTLVDPPFLGPPFQQDDAGSGDDAPNNSTTEGPLVQPGQVYDGILTGISTDPEDRYAFTATAGQTIHLRVFGLQGCAGLRAPDGDDFASTCHIMQNGVYSVYGRAPADGVHHLYTLSAGAASYRFAFMLDAFAPDPAPVPLPPLPWANDAGSGHDAPNIRVPLLQIGTGIHEGAAPLMPDWSDWYLLDASEGQTVEAKLRSGGAGCVAIWHVDEEIQYACTISLGDLDKTTTRVLDRPGDWYVHANDLAGPYVLSVGVDEPAPPLGPL